jgi:DNA-binding beta-propeller fold protein YncE
VVKSVASNRLAPLLQIALLSGSFLGCASQHIDQSGEQAGPGGGVKPISTYTTLADVTLGEPLAVTIDFNGEPVVADGVPGRLIGLSTVDDSAVEFQKPAPSPGFNPSDIKLSGFFIYALDAVGRLLLRFDKSGAYRDVLISFDERFSGRRISPVGMDVDGSGRVAVTDVKNHQVLLFDTYLEIELVFGSYGGYPGQLNSPEGISFTKNGDLLVTDSGNRRLQCFDSGGRFLKEIPPSSLSNPMSRPRRAVMDDEGNAYVADPIAGRVFVFSDNGVLTRSIHPEGSPQFKPTDVEITSEGLIFVTDAANRALFVFR